MEHTNVTFNDNGTLTMIPRHPLVWVPELSAGKEDDVLVLPNIALLVSGSVLEGTSHPDRTKLFCVQRDRLQICRNDHFCEIGQKLASILHESLYVFPRASLV
jgi:hypothetical protein